MRPVNYNMWKMLVMDTENNYIIRSMLRTSDLFRHSVTIFGLIIEMRQTACVNILDCHQVMLSSSGLIYTVF
jgi:hypothetical protein